MDPKNIKNMDSRNISYVVDKWAYVLQSQMLNFNNTGKNVGHT